LEESSDILKAFIPRMVDDALKLTVDLIFKRKVREKPREKTVDDAAQHEREEEEVVHPVEGYKDYENMWECIM
jgi:hypothetical protein